MNTALPQSSAFVLFPLGGKRFALPAESVAELAVPGQVQSIPHTNAIVAGFLLRRGRIVPVCDAARVLATAVGSPKDMYLIANRRFEDGPQEWTAIGVTGDCELCSAVMLPPTGKLPSYVVGLLSLEDEIVEVLDLDRLASAEVRK